MSVIHTNGTPVAASFPLQSPAYGILFLFVVEVITGNVFLILTVLKNKTFGNKSTTNYFIISLAVADLIVGTTVMPIGVVSLMYTNWVFGQIMCEVWQTLDFFACTASILNLCCISLDRYWAITDPLNYTRKMTKVHVCLLISSVWIMSGILTFPPMIWHRIDDYRNECYTDDCHCNSLFVETNHVIFLTVTTFFLPLLVMLFVNYRIYQIAIKQIYSIYSNKRGGGNNQMEFPMRHLSLPPPSTTTPSERNTKESTTGQKNHPNYRLYKKQYKVTKTLGIVMGVFVVCWLPYFVFYTANTIYPPLFSISENLFTITLWFGWINSGMNPIIYTCLSKKFRKSFSETVLCTGETQVGISTI